MVINYKQYVFTTRYVVKERTLIVCVVHDEDGDWQFFGKEFFGEMHLIESDAMVLSLSEIIDIDPTIKDTLSIPKKKMCIRHKKNDKWIVYDL